jgi:RNA exonuclease 1
MEGLFERIGRTVTRSSWVAGTGGEKIQTAVIDHDNLGMMHGSMGTRTTKRS